MLIRFCTSPAPSSPSRGQANDHSYYLSDMDVRPNCLRGNRATLMTIPITNEDIAEARKLASQTIWSIDEWPDRATSYEAPHIIAHAQTIAKLRVARDALEAANKAATTMRNSSKLVGQYPNDPKRNHDWVKARYHDGREIHAITKPALDQIKRTDHD